MLSLVEWSSHALAHAVVATWLAVSLRDALGHREKLAVMMKVTAPLSPLQLSGFGGTFRTLRDV
jgi:hypothetical protein